ncbi:MAG: substrate-binding domain-containing protein [Anaerolineae bacterium]
MPNNHRVTLRDVAEHSGVSYQTVSRVINHHPYVAEETLRRVLDSIAALDYRPNKAARSLAAHRSNTIALVATDLQDYGPAQVVINIERAAKAAGYDLALTIAPDTSSASMRAAIAHVLHWRVDGILILKPITGVSYDEMVQIIGGIPLVQLNSQLEQVVPSIMIDQEQGVRLLVKHLHDLGHRRFCAIQGPSNSYDAIARQVTWDASLREMGMPASLSCEGDWSAASGYRATLAILDQTHDFTALFAANDQMALGALRALREHRVRVPEDVSVVGFDDVPESAYYEPPLTTIHQDFGLLGEMSIQYLVERITDPEIPIERRMITPYLVERQSTAPLRKAT